MPKFVPHYIAFHATFDKPVRREINQAFVPHWTPICATFDNEVPHASILSHIKYTSWQSNPPHLEKYGT